MLRVRLVNCLAVLAITIAAVPPLGSSHPQPQLEDLEKRGRAALRRGHYGKALDTFEALVAREPLNPSYHYGKGVALSSLLDHGAAVDALEEAVALDPQFAPAFQQLVIVYSQLARTESTLAAFQKARSLGPVPESMRLPLARALRERDLFEEALSVLEGGNCGSHVRARNHRDGKGGLRARRGTSGDRDVRSGHLVVGCRVRVWAMFRAAG